MTHLGHEARQQGVAGNVEGHPQAQVAAALVHLAGQLPISHKKLQAGARE